MNRVFSPNFEVKDADNVIRSDSSTPTLCQHAASLLFSEYPKALCLGTCQLCQLNLVLLIL